MWGWKIPFMSLIMSDTIEKTMEHQAAGYGWLYSIPVQMWVSQSNGLSIMEQRRQFQEYYSIWPKELNKAWLALSFKKCLFSNWKSIRALSLRSSLDPCYGELNCSSCQTFITRNKLWNHTWMRNILKVLWGILLARSARMRDLWTTWATGKTATQDQDSRMRAASSWLSGSVSVGRRAVQQD